jgi:hypothetical protein
MDLQFALREIFQPCIGYLIAWQAKINIFPL